MGEQPRLRGNAVATAVASDAVVRCEHPVARHDDRNRVRADGATDGAAGRRPTGCETELAVGDDLTPLEVDELGPDRPLELGARVEDDGKVEVVASAGEVLDELLRCSVEEVVGVLRVLFEGKVAVFLDRQRRDGRAVARDLEPADGAVDAAEEGWRRPGELGGD